MIKAVFLDIDGTLLSHTTGGVPPSAQEAISQLRQRNIKLFLAAGRHILEIHRLPVGKFSFDGYVTLNGQILEHWGIAPEEIMAFGDGENDMDMLRFAGVGVAMGNAPDSVKACADYVTGSVDCDGIFSALRRYSLL